MIADQAGTTVWRWDQGEPFGNDVPNNNPTGQGAFDFPLRFPGQYFDRETNLAYNWYRDYDPTIGRFVEADPLGFIDGPSLFAFVRLNPLIFADPTGRSVWGWIKKKGSEKGLAGGLGAELGGQCAKKACKKNWGQPAPEPDATQICADLMSNSGLTFQANYNDIFFTCRDTCMNLSKNCKCLEKPDQCACK